MANNVITGHVSVSQGTKLLSTAERAQAPFGWWKVGQDVVTCSSICSFAPQSRAALEAIPHLRFVERNNLTPVRRLLSLTHAGLGKYIPNRALLTSAMNEWSREVFSSHHVPFVIRTLHLVVPK